MMNSSVHRFGFKDQKCPIVARGWKSWAPGAASASGSRAIRDIFGLSEARPTTEALLSSGIETKIAVRGRELYLSHFNSAKFVDLGQIEC